MCCCELGSPNSGNKGFTCGNVSSVSKVKVLEEMDQ